MSFVIFSSWQYLLSHFHQLFSAQKAYFLSKYFSNIHLFSEAYTIIHCSGVQNWVLIVQCGVQNWFL